MARHIILVAAHYELEVNEMRKSRLIYIFQCIVIFLSLVGCDDEEKFSPSQDESYSKVVLLEYLDEVDTWSEYEIRSEAMDGNILELCLEFSGGCEDHVFEIFAKNSFSESYPVQGWAKIIHDDLGDTCEALIRKCFKFDLEPLRNLYVDGYQSLEGTIIINLEGFENQIVYTF